MNDAENRLDSRDTLDLLTIDAADVARYRTECELAGASPATVARRLSALRSFGTYASAHGSEPALSPETEIARPAVESTSSTELLTTADAEALLAAADRISRRAAALIRLVDAGRGRDHDVDDPATFADLLRQGVHPHVRRTRCRGASGATSGGAPVDA